MTLLHSHCAPACTPLCLLHLQFAPPVFLPVPRADGSFSHLRGQHGIIVLLSDDGAVLALNSQGQKLWHVSGSARGEGCM
jgi:hypothetical protein